MFWFFFFLSVVPAFAWGAKGLPYVRIDLEFIYSAVTMTGPQALPPEVQCKDKFLIKSVVASPCATTEDVVRKLVIL